jgi:hypothetical protein
MLSFVVTPVAFPPEVFSTELFAEAPLPEPSFVFPEAWLFPSEAGVLPQATKESNKVVAINNANTFFIFRLPFCLGHAWFPCVSP